MLGLNKRRELLYLRGHVTYRRVNELRKVCAL